MWQASKRIYIKRGLKGFFDGNLTNIVKVFPETGIRVYLYYYLINKHTDDPKNAPYLTRLKYCLYAGAISHFLIYPLEVIRTRLVISD